MISRRLVKRALLLGWVSLAASCEPTVGPSVVASGLEEIEPRASWEEVYGEVALCLGKSADFPRVRWFTAERIEGEGGDGTTGVWLGLQGEPHGIAILERVFEGASRQVQSDIVRHESIHELLQVPGHDGEHWCRCDPHPASFGQCR